MSVSTERTVRAMRGRKRATVASRDRVKDAVPDVQPPGQIKEFEGTDRRKGRRGRQG
jgi:hypothetical protein